MARRRWRLLIGPDVPGPEQMAIDMAVQEARIQDVVPATLRLYRFSPACVTLGRFQSEATVDTLLLDERGIGLARRPTGGRGVLHDDEVTYSVVASVEDGLPRGVAASYTMLGNALAATYRLLGVDARLVSRDRPHASGGACYLQSTRADLLCGEAKLSGSAQVWRKDVCLQHGSIVRTRDVRLESAVFRLSEAESARLASEAVTLRDVLGQPPSRGEIEEALVSAFEAVLGVEFEQGTLVGFERARSEELAPGLDLLAAAGERAASCDS
ncbi:MAG: lipoate--protein ligase family protein [Coriobacteriia bacterium]